MEVSLLAKLDFRTKLFLHIARANVVRHETEHNDVYVFENHDDFADYFKIHTGNYVNNDLIDLAIFTTSKSGQIIAFKGLCEKIIAAQLGLKNF